MHPFSGFTSSVCQLRPESRGHIHITSPDAHAHPHIFANYLSATADQLCAIRAVRFAREMTEMPSLAPYVVREHTVCGDMSSDEDMLNVARRYAQTIYHPTSTCRMGIDNQLLLIHNYAFMAFKICGLQMPPLCQRLYLAIQMRLLMIGEKGIRFNSARQSMTNNTHALSYLHLW